MTHHAVIKGNQHDVMMCSAWMCFTPSAASRPMMVHWPGWQMWMLSDLRSAQTKHMGLGRFSLLFICCCHCWLLVACWFLIAAVTFFLVVVFCCCILLNAQQDPWGTSKSHAGSQDWHGLRVGVFQETSMDWMFLAESRSLRSFLRELLRRRTPLSFFLKDGFESHHGRPQESKHPNMQTADRRLQFF